ncbi:fimbrial protein [Bordetella trematum]|uniref:fimbrial protein n=1 Tax=Bordetella trematum TaxID=123899 RepID=UPI000D8D3463|nr:fimbrial protein [Bordetella trematum]SPU51236.1 fimbrial subunit [Bordetella trematum]VDH05584.1 fimbrial protein [Bordetella trematum]
MSLRRVSAPLCALSLTLTVVAPANAVDGTITINGEISDQTCKIEGKDPPHNLIVNLPKISTSALKSVNATAGATLFTIKVTDCPMTLTGDIKVYFEPGPTTDYDKGYLYAYTETTAKTTPETGIPDRSSASKVDNVSIQLVNTDDTVIKMGAGVGEQGALGQTLVNASEGSSKTATLRYLARYIKSGEGAIKAGKLVSYVQYSIVYP